MNMQSKSRPSREQHAASIAAFQQEGLKNARAIGNRGPVRFDADGKLQPDILDAFNEHGFYVFEGMIDADEIAELRADANTMLERAPVDRHAQVDARGRPALGIGSKRPLYRFVAPLADPLGGTKEFAGRHPAQMAQPRPDDDAPTDVVYLMYGVCQEMPSGLRLYGHPHLLAIAEAINGPDFVPYNDAVFVKQAGLGGSVAWHQDGVTHWNSPDWDPGIHGFNFQVQLYPTTPGNGLWIKPGTHRQGRLDIKRMVQENGGSELLPGVMPLICDAGDVTIVNRQMLHGSFANSSDDIRISINFGFHRYRAVLGQKTAIVMAEQNTTYDAKRIHDRSAVIAVAIDARAQYYPNETPFSYKLFADKADDYRFNEETFDRVIRDYFNKDLAI